MKQRIAVAGLLCLAAAAFAADFGVVLGAEGECAGAIAPEGFSLASSASPWISAVLNERVNFHASGKLAYGYAAQGEPTGSFFFEPERTELQWRPAPSFYLTLGRQRFQDALGIAASGLFDGALGSVNFAAGRLSLGAFYTGLLYKESAKILMTSADRANYAKPLATEGPSAYFASRRALLALAGEFPGLTPRTGLTVQGLAQLDLNDARDTLNSYYLEARLTAEPREPLHLDAGVLGELLQGADEPRGSAAVSAGLEWEVPGLVSDLLSAKLLWTGGSNGGRGGAYVPVSGISAGRIFDPFLGALMSAGLSYRARPLAALSLEAGAAYFIRTDLESLADPELEGDSTSRLLGGEVYASLAWAPDPALRLTLGGGAFFPGWGGAFREDAPPRRKLSLGLIVSL
jgi:hypothetical protein